MVSEIKELSSPPSIGFETKSCYAKKYYEDIVENVYGKVISSPPTEDCPVQKLHNHLFTHPYVKELRLYNTVLRVLSYIPIVGFFTGIFQLQFYISTQFAVKITRERVWQKYKVAKGKWSGFVNIIYRFTIQKKCIDKIDSDKIRKYIWPANRKMHLIRAAITTCNLGVIFLIPDLLGTLVRRIEK